MLNLRTLAAIASFSTLLLASPAFAQNVPVPDAPDWSKATTVPLAITNYHFTPDALQFHANLPYRFRLTNNAGGGAVTVTTTGPGSMYFNIANSHSGSSPPASTISCSSWASAVRSASRSPSAKGSDSGWCSTARCRGPP